MSYLTVIRSHDRKVAINYYYYYYYHEKCIVVTRVCVSVRGRMPTLLHGPGCNLGEW